MNSFLNPHSFAQATPHASHLAWFLLSKCVCHALSFDARLISSPGLLPVAESVDAAIAAALDDIFATKLTAAHRRQMALTGAFGGCGLRQEGRADYADATFYAAWTAKSDRVVALSRDLGRPFPFCGGGLDAELAKARLAVAGVIVNDAGGARLNHDAAVSYGTCAWSADQALDELGALRTDAAPAPPVHAAPDMVPARRPPAAPLRLAHLQAPRRDPGCGGVACGY